MNKRYVIYLATGAVALATIGVVAATTVSAASPAGSANPMTNLVNAIAQKFNLNASDVQKIFDDQKAQMKVQMDQRYTDRINQAVTDGKLTQDQANKILAKKAELQAQRQSQVASLQGKTKAEIQAEMKTQMDALKQWATDNNIPMEYLMFGPMGGHGFGRGMHGSMMPQNNQPAQQ
jgi:hypothetical protein